MTDLVLVPQRPDPPVKHLSYSSMQLFSDCSEAWRRRYVEKLPEPTSPALVFGSAIHAAIQEMVRASVFGQAHDPMDHWRREWNGVLEREDVVWGADRPEELGLLGLSIIQHSDVKTLALGLEPLVIGDQLAIEHKIELRVPDVPVPVIGFIDLIDASGVPYDFKTAGRMWPADRADKELQASFYLAALRQAGRTDNPGNLFRYVVISKTRTPQVRVFETRRSARDFLGLIPYVQGIWRAIEREAYTLNPSSWRCNARYCCHFHECWGAGQQEEVNGVPLKWV
jgi:putative RecB family exonuclease